MNTAVIQWVKHHPSPWAKLVRNCFYALRNPSVPAFKPLFRPLLCLHQTTAQSWAFLTRVLYFTPMFKARINKCGSNLYLYSGMPQVLGNLDIQLGSDVRMSGISTFCGRTAAKQTPKLRIGNNVDIGWQNSISVGTHVDIQDNVRLAGRVFLAGFPGHPMDPELRRLGHPETDEQAKPIVLEEDVWVGTGATILAGVTVGKGSIVAAGAVVTKSVPARCIVAGNPAKVVKRVDL